MVVLSGGMIISTVGSLWLKEEKPSVVMKNKQGKPKTKKQCASKQDLQKHWFSFSVHVWSLLKRETNSFVRFLSIFEGRNVFVALGYEARQDLVPAPFHPCRSWMLPCSSHSALAKGVFVRPTPVSTRGVKSVLWRKRALFRSESLEPLCCMINCFNVLPGRYQ